MPHLKSLPLILLFAVVSFVGNGYAQRGILSLEARLQVDYLESVERLEMERATRTAALNSTFSEKLIALNKRLKGLDKTEDAEVVAEEVRRLGRDKPKVAVRDEDPAVLNQFREVYLKELSGINDELDKQRASLTQDYEAAKTKLPQADVAIPSGSRGNLAGAPAGTQLPAYQPPTRAAPIVAPAVTDRTVQAQLNGHTNVREYAVPDTDFIKIVRTDPAMPAKLAVGSSIKVTVAYNKVTKGRAQVSLYPFASEGLNHCVSRSKNIFANGSGEMSLELKATGNTIVDKLRVEMKQAVSGEHMTQDTEHVRILWFTVAQ